MNMKQSKKKILKHRAAKIKKSIQETNKVIEKIGCNRESASRNIDFESEESRKRMAQNFFR